MTVTNYLPERHKVHDILTILYGRGVTLGNCETNPNENDKNMLAVYINDKGELSTACACSYNFAAYAGSAITKISLDNAEHAATTGDFSNMMSTNLYQVMNIFSCIFQSNTNSKITFDQMYQSVNEAPERVRNLFENVTQRIAYDVEIPGYGNGVITIMCA